VDTATLFARHYDNITTKNSNTTALFVRSVATEHTIARHKSKTNQY